MQSVAVLPRNPGSCDLPLNGLDHLAIELTDKCNLECVHCYADSGPSLPLFQSMQLADWKRAIAEGYDAGCRKIQFIGGEPTIHPHLIELVQFSRTLGYHAIEVFTNGTAFTDKLKSAFAQFRVNLAFSVYSNDSVAHDAVTLHTGSFAATISSIKWAVGECLPVRAAVVEMKENEGRAEETKGFLEAMGVQEVRVDRSRGFGRGGVGRLVPSPIDELCGNCWRNRLCIAPNGEVYPCVFSRAWVMGTASDGIKSIINGDRLLSFRTALRSRVESSTSNCNPQCGPDCPPATCGPQGG